MIKWAAESTYNSQQSLLTQVKKGFLRVCWKLQHIACETQDRTITNQRLPSLAFTSDSNIKSRSGCVFSPFVNKSSRNLLLLLTPPSPTKTTAETNQTPSPAFASAPAICVNQTRYSPFLPFANDPSLLSFHSSFHLWPAWLQEQGRREGEESQFAQCDLTQMNERQQARRAIIDVAEFILFGSVVSSSRFLVKNIYFCIYLWQVPFSISQFLPLCHFFCCPLVMFGSSYAASFCFLVRHFSVNNTFEGKFLPIYYS